MGQLQSLVRKLRSHKLDSKAKKKKRQNGIIVKVQLKSQKAEKDMKTTIRSKNKSNKWKTGTNMRY